MPLPSQSVSSVLVQSALRAQGLATFLVSLPHLFIVGSAAYDADLSWLAVAAVLGTEWLALVLLLTPLLMGLSLGSRKERSRNESSKSARKLSRKGVIRIVSALSLWAFLWIYLLSWGLFDGSEHFIDLASLRMGSTSFTLLLKHFLEFDPGKFFSIPLLAFALAGLVFWLLRSQNFHAERARIRRQAICAVGFPLLALCVVFAGWTSSAFSARMVKNQKTGSVRTLRAHLSEVLRNGTGPLLHFSLDWLAPLSSGDKWALRSPPLPVERVKISAANSYSSQIRKDAPRYHVIVLLIESLRRDVLRNFGGTRDVMTHVDALAAKSLRFTRAFAQATHSDYADVTAVSSQLPLRYRMHTPYPKSTKYPRVLLHDLLKERGYRTAVISSQNEHWAGMIDYLSTPGLDLFFHSESFHRTYMPEEDTDFMQWTETWKRSGKLDDRDTMDEVLRFIGDAREPFCLYINLQNSHFPYRFPEDSPFQPSEVDFSFKFSGFPRDKMPVVLNRYHNALHYMDAEIGRLISHLENKGQLENTVFLISGDTGQAFYEHGFATHGKMAFNELIHLPLLIHAPGHASEQLDVLLSQVDFAPTILDLLNMPPFPGFQGRSALALDGLDTPPRVVFTGRQIPGVHELVVIQENYKFFLLADGTTLLFDLEKDPNEKHNLSQERPLLTATLRHTALSYRDAQLSYYADPKRMSEEFPPQLRVLPLSATHSAEENSGPPGH